VPKRLSLALKSPLKSKKPLYLSGAMQRFKMCVFALEVAVFLLSVHILPDCFMFCAGDLKLEKDMHAGGRRDRIARSYASSKHFNRIGVFSAYTSRPEETDDTPFTTADGTNLKRAWQCIVANNTLPFGTKIDIKTVGVCVIRDRMHPRYGARHFDIYFGNDLDAALEFGRRKLAYRIVK
jgi:3D (Asp-Asp-Asp) domain-containing protein